MDEVEFVEQKPVVRGRRLALLKANQQIFLMSGHGAAEKQVENSQSGQQGDRVNESNGECRNEENQEIEVLPSDDGTSKGESSDEGMVIDVTDDSEQEGGTDAAESPPKKKRRGRQRQIIKCKSCKKTKPNHGNGHCRTCYTRIYHSQYKDKNLRKCNVCDETKNHAAKGMCLNCYIRVVVKPKQKSESYKNGNLRECSECGQLKRHEAKGMCKICYERVVRAPKMRSKNYSLFDLIECKECGERRKHAAKGLCRQCYNHQSYKNSSGKPTKKIKTEKPSTPSKSLPLPVPIKVEEQNVSSNEASLSSNQSIENRPTLSAQQMAENRQNSATQKKSTVTAKERSTVKAKKSTSTSRKSPQKQPISNAQKPPAKSTSTIQQSTLESYLVKIEQTREEDVKPPLDELIRLTCQKTLKKLK